MTRAASAVVPLFLLPCIVAAEPVFRDGLEGGVPCEPLVASGGDAALVADVDSVLVQPQFLLDGAPFPHEQGETALFSLEDADGFQVALGASNAPPDPVRVRPGVYDLYYSWNAGTLVPRNVHARLHQALRILGDGALVVDVPSVAVAGAISLDGAPFPASLAHRGRMSLQAVYGRGTVLMGPTHTTSPVSLRLIPGAYHLVYEHLVGDGQVPRNESARVTRLALDVDAAGLAFDVPSVAASLTYAMNGVPLPAEDYEDGTVELRTVHGDRVPMGSTSSPGVVARIVPGSYDVHWTIESGGASVPVNRAGVLATGIEVQGATEVAFDAIAAQVNLDWNGAPPPDSPYENADIVLVDRATGGETPLGNSRDQPLQANLLPGIYDVYQRTVISNGDAPYNPQALVAAGWQPQATPVLALDVPVKALYLSPTLNGAAFPSSIYEQARVLLRGSHPDDVFELGLTSEQPWYVPLVAGTYQVLYRHLLGTAVPQNPQAVLAGTVRVSAGASTPIFPSELPIDAAVLSLGVRFDGVPLPAGNSAQVTLLGAEESMSLGSPSAADIERFLVAGTYRVRVRHTGGAAIAANQAATVACVVLQVP